MRNFYFPRFFFLTLALFCIQNLSSTNRDTQAVDFESYSLEELNYDLCGLYNAKKLDAFDVTRNVENFRELSPSVYKGLLVRYICNPLPSIREFTDADFQLQASSFLKNNSSALPNCTNENNKDKCFGQGIIFNGYFLGEWQNNKPHGQGIQLITKVLPFGFSPCLDGIYEGGFKSGRFHGQGRYQTCHESFEGNWRKGQMHGFIDWEWPDNYRFGIELERHSSGFLRLKDVVPFSAADAGGLKKGDFVSLIELEEESIETKESGVLSILNKLRDLPIDQIVTFHIYDMEVQNFVPVTISKSMMDSKTSGTLLCLDIAEGECYQKAQYQNLYVNRFGKQSRGSYLMGLKHSYALQDVHITYQDDGSFLWNRYCKNKSLPMNFMSMEKEFIKAVKEVSPGVFFFNDDQQAPCKKIFKGSKPELIFIDLLLENDSAIDAIEKSFLDDENNSMNRFDIIDYLNDALSLQKLGKDMPSDHPTYQFCSVAVIASVFCFEWVTDINERYQNYISKSLSLTPSTFLSDRRKEMQLLRAKENYIYIRHCVQSGIEKNSSAMNIVACMQDQITDTSRFWNCVYHGDDFATCDRNGYQSRGDKKLLADYKKLHADHLNAVDFKEWLFGDL